MLPASPRCSTRGPRRIGAVALLVLATALASGCGDEDALSCGPGTRRIGDTCLPSDVCGDHTQYDPQTGQCVGLACAAGTVAIDGECVPDGSVFCQTGTRYQDGACVPDITGCAEGTVLLSDECVPYEDGLMGDVVERSEPNAAGAGEFDVPVLGKGVTLQGCTTPYDQDGDGDFDADIDDFRFTTTGPTFLRITVDGMNGQLGAFTIFSADADSRLAEDGWYRTGVNLVSDAVVRGVFVPDAGDFVLRVADGRSLLSGTAVGGPSTCYFATVQHRSIPVADAIDSGVTGSFSGEPRFLRATAQSMGGLIDATVTENSPSVRSAVTFLRNGRYAGSGRAGGPGQAGRGRGAGFAPEDHIVVVVDEALGYSLSPVSWTLSLAQTAVPMLASDAFTTIENDLTTLESWAWFEAQAGELVEIELDDASVTLRDFDPSLQRVEATLCAGCAGFRTVLQVRDSGIHYLGMTSSAVADGASFQVDASLHRHVPTAITAGVAAVSNALGASGESYFEMTAAELEWLVTRASTTGFSGALRVLRYPRLERGYLDLTLPARDDYLFATGAEEFGEVHVTEERILVRALDSAFDGVADDESLALELGSRAPIVLDSVGTTTGLDIEADGTRYLWVDFAPGLRSRVGLASIANADLRLRRIDLFEQTQASSNVGGIEEAESLEQFTPERSFVLFAIDELSGTDGTFAANLALRQADETRSSSGATSVTPGVAAVAELVATSTCAIGVVAVTLKLQGGENADTIVTLTSPEGTSRRLHDQSGGLAQLLDASYPALDTPAQSLNVLNGESAVGSWTLSVETERFARTLQSWKLELYCAP